MSYNVRTKMNSGICEENPNIVTDEEKCFKYLFEKMGLCTAATCGILSNLYYESKYNSEILQIGSLASLSFNNKQYTEAVDNGSYKDFVCDLTGYGLVQWTLPSRKEALLQYAKKTGRSIGNMEMQLEFFSMEIKEYKDVWRLITECENSAEGAYSVGHDVCYYYEQPLKKETDSAIRGNYAAALYDKYNS